MNVVEQEVQGCPIESLLPALISHPSFNINGFEISWSQMFACDGWHLIAIHM